MKKEVLFKKIHQMAESDEPIDTDKLLATLGEIPPATQDKIKDVMTKSAEVSKELQSSGVTNEETEGTTEGTTEGVTEGATNEERYLKVGFYFSSLTRGDTIKHSQTNEIYIIISVGADSAFIKDSGGRQIEITSLNGYEPVNVKALNENVTIPEILKDIIFESEPPRITKGELIEYIKNKKI